MIADRNVGKGDQNFENWAK